MKKFFIILILILLALMAATPYFAGILFELPEDLLASLYSIRIILNYILSAAAIAWLLGTGMGFLFSKFPCYSIIISVTNSVAVLPAFMLTLLLAFIWGFDFKGLLLSLCIPLFFRAFATSANIFNSFFKNNYKVHMLGLTPAIYFSQYTLPLLISPLFLSFIRLMRSAIISMAFVVFSGRLLTETDTFTFYTLICTALFAVLLLNTLCLIIPPGKGDKTWLKRL